MKNNKYFSLKSENKKNLLLLNILQIFGVLARVKELDNRKGDPELINFCLTVEKDSM